MRSGHDIFRNDPPPQSDYMQPPLSFYKYVIKNHEYKDVLIVAEKDRENPCIDGLLSWRKNIKIKKHISARDDIRTILSARHLVTCHSTFSWSLALMSKTLKTLHQPDTLVINGVGDYSVYTYTFLNYIIPGEWKATPYQLRLMTHHSENDIRVSYQPSVAGGGQSSYKLSCCS